MTREHLVRVIVIAVVFLGSLAALVALLLNGITEGTGFGAVLAAVSMSGPALLESLRVASNQKRDSMRPPPIPGVEEDTVEVRIRPRKRKKTGENGTGEP